MSENIHKRTESEDVLARLAVKHLHHHEVDEFWEALIQIPREHQIKLVKHIVTLLASK